MSLRLNACFKPIQQPDEGYFVFKRAISDQDKLIYNDTTCRFETIPKGCCFSYLQNSDPYQSKLAWGPIKTILAVAIGNRLSQIALIQTKCDQLQNSPLTVRAYWNLLKKAAELETLEDLAYRTWKAGKFYLIFERNRLSGIPSFPPPIDTRSKKKKAATIEIIQNGRELAVHRQYFTRYEIANWIMHLSWKKPLVEEKAALGIALAIEEDLVNLGIKTICLNDLINRIINYVRYYNYRLKKPYRWREIKPLIKTTFKELNFLQLKKLAKIADPKFIIKA